MQAQRIGVELAEHHVGDHRRLPLRSLRSEASLPLDRDADEVGQTGFAHPAEREARCRAWAGSAERGSQFAREGIQPVQLVEPALLGSICRQALPFGVARVPALLCRAKPGIAEPPARS